MHMFQLINAKYSKQLLCLMALIVSSFSSIIAAEKLKPLGKNDGYLLFSVKTQSQIEHIKIRGKKWLNYELKDITDDARYFMTKTQAGDYYFSDIETGLGEIELDSEVDWSFTVEANAISYIGELKITEYTYSVFSYKELIELENKSSFAIEHIQQNYPKLFNSLKIKYTGPGDDPFIEFYMNINND